MKVLNIESWKRKDHYLFYKDFELPFFNVTVDVDVTDLYEISKERGYSFFLLTLFSCLQAVNEIEAFRYRIKDDEVLCFDRVHIGSTILLDDNTFNFCYFEYTEDLDEFVANGLAAIEAQKRKNVLDPGADQLDIIHCSVLPWFSFKSFQNARKLGAGNSIPKIVFGKYTSQDGRKLMPVSVEVHHALMDGWHLAQFFERFGHV